MKKMFLIIPVLSLLLSCDVVYAQVFQRGTAQVDRLLVNQSETIYMSKDSLPPPVGSIKIWMRDTSTVYLIFPTGKKINLKLAGTGGSGGSGSVTSVTSANGDIAYVNPTGDVVLTLNSGTGVGQILKLDGSARIPAVNGSQITGLTTSQVAEGSNKYFTDPRVWNDIHVSGFLGYDPSTGTVQTPLLSVTNPYISVNAIKNNNVNDGELTSGKIASGQVVKTLNGITDNVYFIVKSGGSLTQSNDSLFLSVVGGGGGGSDSLTAIQSPDNSLTITNPLGPTVSIIVTAKGLDSSKIKDGGITSLNIKDGTILTQDVALNFKAPLAGLSDATSSIAGLTAGGDFTGTFPNPTVGNQKITASKILNNTITASQVSTTFDAPFADVAYSVSASPDGLTNLSLGGTVTMGQGDSVQIYLVGIDTNWIGTGNWLGSSTDALVQYGGDIYVRCYMGGLVTISTPKHQDKLYNRVYVNLRKRNFNL